VSGSESLVTADSAGSIASRYLASVRLDAEGHVVDWAVIKGRWITEKRRRAPSDLVYEATVRVTVARETGRPDAGFRLSLAINRVRFAVRSATPSENDEVILTVTATRASSVVLAAISGDSVRLLAPNTVVREARAPAGEPTQWPSAEWRERGLHFRVGLPAGVSARAEVLAAVATLETVPWPRADGGTVALGEFNRWLVAIPADRRAVAQQTVMVERVADETRR
jgi:hypothetical protein